MNSLKKNQRVALWNINGIGTKLLELHLGVLKVLKIDCDADTSVASLDIVRTPRVVDVGASLHNVADVLVLSRVDNS